MAKRPLKATDKRRPGMSDNVRNTIRDTDGAGPPLAELFKDRRKGKNGTGKKAF
jgi:hypothetical protein